MKPLIRFASLFALLLAVPGCGGCGEGPKVPFKPSKETTYITEPVDADGYIDYETALNERLRGTITPETNAAALIWQANGPKGEGREMPPEFFQLLQIKRPDDVGEYLISYSRFLQNRGTDKPIQELEDEHFDGLRDRPWKKNQEPDYVAWLEANSKPLAIMVEASTRPNYFFPIVQRDSGRKRRTLIDEQFPLNPKIWFVIDTLRRRAMWHVGENRIAKAWEDNLTMHRLARLLLNSGTATECLHGVGFDSIAGNADIQFLELTKPDKAMAVNYLKEIRKLKSIPNLKSQVDTAERMMLLDFLQSIQIRGLKSLRKSYFPVDMRNKLEALEQFEEISTIIDWPESYKTLNEWMDRLVKLVEIAEYSKYQAAYKSLDRDYKEQLKRSSAKIDANAKEVDGIAIGKAIGKRIGIILANLAVAPTGMVQRKLFVARQRDSNLQLAFALAAYRAEHGKYPAQLADLAPKFIDNVPLDYFTDKPLVYKPTADGYLLYSVGENGVDDGGATFSEEPKGDDLTVRMPSAK